MNAEHQNIKVFADECDERYTFEVCVNRENLEYCKSLFESRCRTNSVEDYMLANKAECAFVIASDTADKLVVPEYIKKALQWIEN